MSDVIPFRVIEKEKEPHLAGDAACRSCGYRWGAVAPQGTVHLQCPSCRTMWGIFNMPVLPSEGDQVWTCKCGCDLFSLTPAGALCIKCGLLHNSHP